MKELEQALQHYRQHFQQVKEVLPGRQLPWLAELREQAINDFLSQGFPTRKNEDWKYTSTVPLARNNFQISDTAESVNHLLAPELDLFAGKSHQMVFVDGYFVSALSRIAQVPKNALLTSLSDAIQRFPEQVKQYFQQKHQEQQPFSALNMAFMRDGYFLHIPQGCVIEQPVHIIYLTTRGEQFINFRNICIAEENSQATIIEHYIGQTSQAYFNNTISHIDAKAAANIQHYKILQEGHAGFHIGSLTIEQLQHSNTHSYSFAFGGAWTRSDTAISFMQENAQCQLDGLYVMRNAAHVDHHTRVDHCKAHCSSREYYKGILDDEARAVFNGKVYVAPDAQKTDANLSNKNLLLSRHAEIDTKPQLEIYADDVRCTHGVAVGQLDAESLFYLQSRGINQAAAKQLLVHAFANEIIERVELTSLRDKLRNILEQQLPMEKNP